MKFPKKPVKVKEPVEKKEVVVKSNELKDAQGQPIVGVKSEKLGPNEIEGFDPIIKE